MAEFFLSKTFKDHQDRLYPATGLYFYKPKNNNEPRRFERYVIDANGKPRIHVRNGSSELTSVRVRQSAATEPASLFNTWLNLSGDVQKGYLCCVPHEDTAQPTGLSGAVDDLGQDRYALSDSMQLRVLHNALSYRLQEGYDQVRNAIENPNFQKPLIDNAAAFWEAISAVGHNLVVRFCRGDFQDPAWVYHLIRTLSEGFIEGHSRYFAELQQSSPSPIGLNVASGGFDTASVDHWMSVLQHTQDNFTIRRGFRLPENLSEEEEAALMSMVNALTDVVGIPVQGSVLRIMILSFFIDLLTPGRPPSQSIFGKTPGIPEPAEFAFWHLHYPHWGVDLLNALKRYGPGPKLDVGGNQNDWDRILRTIMRNYPQANATVGDQVAGELINSQISEFVVRILLRTNMDFLVRAIIGDVRSKAMGL